LYADFIAFEESIAFPLGLEMDAEFCVDDIADYQRAFTRRIL
jgi:hypothetical protein